MKGHRMSSLPIAQYCAHGPRLGQASAGRAAAMSTAFHATASKSPDALEKMRRLSDAEIAEVMSWRKPAPITLEGGVTLVYEKAARELEVGLDARGNYCEASDPACISVGHLDMAWEHTVNGARVAYIGDIKRSSWTTLDGPDSLQLVAYAFAFASLMKCDYFCCGIWAATEAEWTWGELVDLESARAATLLNRVLASIQNASPEYSTGAHCTGCYGRRQCPAYLLPPEMAETSLAPLVSGELTPDTALRLLMLCERAEDTRAVAMAALKTYVAQGGIITDPESGKRWGAIKMSGRESFDKAAAEADGIDLSKYTKRGSPYAQNRWLKS